MFILSINNPNKRCIIHKHDCSSLNQVIHGRPSLNQKYLDFKDCYNLNQYIHKHCNNYVSWCCKKCNPSCCK